MSHTFLALDMDLIPQSTKDNVPTFYKGMFSNDNSRMLIDGYNNDGNIVHSEHVLMSWLQWEEDPQDTYQLLINNAIEYTAEDIKTEQSNVNSIWYVQYGEEL